MAESSAISRPPRVRVMSRWWLVLGFTILIAACAAALAIKNGLAPVGTIGAVAALALFTLPYMAFAYTSVARDVSRWLATNRLAPFAVTGFFLLVYLLYAVTTGAFDALALARLVAFAAAPTLLIMWAREQPFGAWQDFAAVACIWLPFNFGLLAKVWTWPEGEAAYILNTPLAMDLALVLFLGVRRAHWLGFRLQFVLRDIPLILGCLAAFMLIALPIGLGSGFIVWNPRPDAIRLLGQPLAIFFFIAVPEELLFRGLVLGLLARRSGRPYVALVVSALLFGASHWHNPGMPDFRYLGLASIAGIFYGWVYLRTGRIAASALLHASVDALWELMFHT